MRPLTFLRLLFAPLWIVGVYIIIRIYVEGALGLILAIPAVLVGVALMVRTVRHNRRK